MHWIGRLLPIHQVAGRAGRRESQIISNCGVLMTFLAFHNRVSAKQRKTVEVLLNRLDGHLPTKNRMALGAIGAELSPMNVRVAIGAALAHVGENRLGVASRAGYLFMHAAQWVPRGVVAEFRDGANRGPAGVGVAILTRYGEGAVRTPARLPLRGRCANGAEGQEREQETSAELERSGNDCPQMS